MERIDEGFDIGAKRVGTTRDVTQTEAMLNEVLGLIKAVESRLEIVLSDETSLPDEVPNIQNAVQAKLFDAIQRLQTLKNRINL